MNREFRQSQLPKQEVRLARMITESLAVAGGDEDQGDEVARCTVSPSQRPVVPSAVTKPLIRNG